jgi:hypothetical protein
MAAFVSTSASSYRSSEVLDISLEEETTEGDVVVEERLFSDKREWDEALSGRIEDKESVDGKTIDFESKEDIKDKSDKEDAEVES